MDRSEESTESRERLPSSGAQKSPKRIGQYTIRREIASGGMGTVYEALQEKPRRAVAIKLMRAGIASRSALRRFKYESQTLARLQHPGIAQVFDAGTHKDGAVTVPYFAMEYIVGAKPITEYAKEHDLATCDRMRLFASVCDAVHHGHQKGVVHRDLKPSNILVDSSGNVKVIDFGVARGTDSDMAVTTLQTDVGQLIGTLQYMSPEQCAADPHDIDTRSDVYALGVVLYELLCGRLPYDVRGAVLHEATRVVREQMPCRLGAIEKSLRGDVETIVMRAMEKNRERRYQSASALLADIRRFLSNEAISARPPSLTHQLRVFARRHRAVAAATLIVFAVLVAGVIVSSTLYVQARDAKYEANMKAAEAVAARKKAEESVKQTHEVVQWLQDMLWTADPSRVGREVKLATLLDRAGPLLPHVFDGQPRVEAELHTTFGRTYQELVELGSAETHLRSALDIRKRVLGDEHAATLTSMHDLAALLWIKPGFPRSVDCRCMMRTDLSLQNTRFSQASG